MASTTPSYTVRWGIMATGWIAESEKQHQIPQLSLAHKPQLSSRTSSTTLRPVTSTMYATR